MRTLFFSPHADIDRHALPEAVLAMSLKNSKDEIFYVTCSGILNRICNCMTAKGLGINEDSTRIQKQKVCLECVLKKENILATCNFNEISIENFISTEEELKTEKFIRKTRNVLPENIKYDGISIGRYAAYEFVLNWKIPSLKLNKKERQRYEQHLRNCFLVAKAIPRIINQVKPERVFMYNANYSINRLAFEIFKKHKIKTFSIHGGSHISYRYNSLSVEEDLRSQYLLNISKEWVSFKSAKFTNRQEEFAQKHINEWKTGKDLWVFSAPYKKKDNLIKTKINKQKFSKIVTVLLASSDERFAATLSGALPNIKNQWFSDQKEWVNEILSFAKRYKKVFFIFRVHPREYPNKREKILSKNSIFYTLMKKRKLDNIWVNTPDENVSLHNLIEVSDVALNQTSTSGLEFLFSGIPVIGTNPEILFAYPPEFNIYFPSKIDYEKNLLNKFVCKVSKLEILKWVYFKSTHSTIFLPKIEKALAPKLALSFLYKNTQFFRTHKFLRNCSESLLLLKTLKNKNARIEINAQQVF